MTRERQCHTPQTTAPVNEAYLFKEGDQVQLNVRSAQVILAALLLMIFGQTLYAQNNGRWIYLGESNVDGNTDHD